MLVAGAKRGPAYVVPTAAARQGPEEAVAHAKAWFRPLGLELDELHVLKAADANSKELAALARAGGFFYLVGGDPGLVAQVLRRSRVWTAIFEAWLDGASLAGSSAGAMVLCDPMVDQRGGAFTLGLGLLSGLAVVPHHDTWSEEKVHRTQQLAPKGLVVAGVDERTALVRNAAGGWTAEGTGAVSIWRDGDDVGLDALP